jgi:hypothetical protein
MVRVPALFLPVCAAALLAAPPLLSRTDTRVPSGASVRLFVLWGLTGVRTGVRPPSDPHLAPPPLQAPNDGERHVIVEWSSAREARELLA